MKAWMLGLGWLAACGADVAPVREDVVDLLFQDPPFEVVVENDRNAPELDFLRVKPAVFEPHVMGGARELPAVLLPPPANVEFLIPDVRGGELELSAAFAVDHFDAKKRKANFTADVHGTVQLVRDGQERSVFQVKLHVQGKTPDEIGWQVVIDEATGEPLRVRPGDRVRFATRYIKAPNRGTLPKVGVAGLTLRTVQEFAPKTATPEQPNVVMIVMDTLRADRTHTHGYDLETTPVLDALAERGIAFDNARATSSWTWPSTVSMLTGLAPEEHGLVYPGSAWLRSEHVTLAELMQRAGLATGAFIGNRLVAADFHFDQGFQTFHAPDANAFVDGVDLVPPALEWMDKHADERFFLYLHLVDPHREYEPLELSIAALPGQAPADERHYKLEEGVWPLVVESRAIADRKARPLLAEHYRPIDLDWMDRSYDQVVHSGDYWVGEVLAKLEALGLKDNTIVVFTSDHGEEIYEHGDASHGQSLHPELVHVPLVIAGPGVPTGERRADVMSNARLFDFLATLSDGPVDLTTMQSDVVFYSTERAMWNGTHPSILLGAERGDWALHLAPETDTWRLYNHATDPEQRHDVAAEFPDVLAELKARLIERAALAAERRLSSGDFGDGEGALQALQEIGYL
jgi:arylsulfatase A-like enzyme